MNPKLDRALVWLRRDLRCDDHAALYHALRQAHHVWCVFVFDQAILAPLPRADRRVEFIRESLVDLNQRLHALGAAHGRSGVGLIVCHGQAAQEITALARELRVQAVYANHDDEPQALERDARVRGELAHMGVALHTSKDHVVFERSEVLTQAGTPYTVFTPYKRAWLAKANPFYLSAYGVEHHAKSLAPLPPELRANIPSLADLGFEPTNLGELNLPTGGTGAQALLTEFFDHRVDHYAQTRDFPAVRGPSYLSTHLRFGTLSIRQAARQAWQRASQTPAGESDGAATWLSELIWRDFYHQLMHHYPGVIQHAFKPAFEAIKWAHGKPADALFQAWTQARTGYPLIDAAMLQIQRSGYMHNRLRMVVASFLVKDLGLDWRRGEAYFAEHLNDFDLAANNGGWQWSASTGCDAQPWFRIFNPVSQSKKFDPQGRFIRRYLPQLAALPDALIHAPWLARPIDLAAAGLRLGVDYPLPVVDHEQARQATLQRYAVVKIQ